MQSSAGHNFWDVTESWVVRLELREPDLLTPPRSSVVRKAGWMRRKMSRMEKKREKKLLPKTWPRNAIQEWGKTLRRKKVPKRRSRKLKGRLRAKPRTGKPSMTR